MMSVLIESYFIFIFKNGGLNSSNFSINATVIILWISHVSCPAVSWRIWIYPPLNKSPCSSGDLWQYWDYCHAVQVQTALIALQLTLQHLYLSRAWMWQETMSTLILNVAGVVFTIACEIKACISRMWCWCVSSALVFYTKMFYSLVQLIIFGPSRTSVYWSALLLALFSLVFDCQNLISTICSYYCDNAWCGWRDETCPGTDSLNKPVHKGCTHYNFYCWIWDYEEPTCLQNMLFIHLNA